MGSIALKGFLLNCILGENLNWTLFFSCYLAIFFMYWSGRFDKTQYNWIDCLVLISCTQITMSIARHHHVYKTHSVYGITWAFLGIEADKEISQSDQEIFRFFFWWFMMTIFSFGINFWYFLYRLWEKEDNILTGDRPIVN